jgi:integrase
MSVLASSCGGAVFGMRDLRSALEQVAKVGGKQVTAHDLRRTYASFAERAGAPFVTLRTLLNHSTRANVTAGYVRPSEADLMHWAARIEAAILAAADSGAVVRLDAADPRKLMPLR